MGKKIDLYILYASIYATVQQVIYIILSIPQYQYAHSYILNKYVFYITAT